MGHNRTCSCRHFLHYCFCCNRARSYRGYFDEDCSSEDDFSDDVSIAASDEDGDPVGKLQFIELTSNFSDINRTRKNVYEKITSHKTAVISPRSTPVPPPRKRYQIHRVLGKGSFGIVRVAIDLWMQQIQQKQQKKQQQIPWVAIKSIRKHTLLMATQGTVHNMRYHNKRMSSLSEEHTERFVSSSSNDSSASMRSIALEENQFSLKASQKPCNKEKSTTQAIKPLLFNDSLRAVWMERYVLSTVARKTPFAVHLKQAFQTRNHLHLVMNFAAGGDLRFHLTHRRRGVALSENEARFYVVEILLGIEVFHQHNVCLRDVKPSNVLIDGDGHLKIADLGLAAILSKQNGYKLHGYVGSPAYCAHEMMHNFYDCSVDIYALGILFYELIHGPSIVPLQDEVLAGSINFKEHVSVVARDLIERLTAPAQIRLSIEDIKRHPFFADIDWNMAACKQLSPPCIPESAGEIAHVDAELEIDAQLGMYKDDTRSPLSAAEQRFFTGWEYNEDIEFFENNDNV